MNVQLPLPLTSNSSSAGVCQTEACVNVANLIKNSLSPNYTQIDPCADFDEYVCGGWRQANPLNGRPELTVSSSFHDIIMDQLHVIMEGQYEDTRPANGSASANATVLSTAAAEADRSVFASMKKVYDLCVDENAIREAGLQPLAAVLDELSPLLTDKQYGKAIAYAGRLGINLFFQIMPAQDYEDPLQNILQIRPLGYLPLLDSAYQFQDPPTLQRYKDAVGQLLSNIRPRLRGTNALVATNRTMAELVDGIVSLEQFLVENKPSFDRLSDPANTNHKMDGAAVAALLPPFQVEEAIQTLTQRSLSTNVTQVLFPDIMANISQEVARRPADIVHGYVLWKTMLQLLPKAAGPDTKPYEDLLTFLKKPTPSGERWKLCIEDMKITLGAAVDRFYVVKHFDPQFKAEATEITSKIRQTTQSMLRELPWMDEETRKAAMEKASKTGLNIGYPDALMDPVAVSNGLGHVDLNGTFFDTYISLQRLLFDNVNAPKKTAPVLQWPMEAVRNDAVYMIQGNSLYIMAAYLLMELVPGAPSYVKYGTLGYVSGHEMTHGFDQSGHHMDSDGRSRNWWTNATSRTYEDKAKCFVKQYDSLQALDDQGKAYAVSGTQNLNENMADVGGIAIGFEAWRAEAEAHPPPKLPGLESFSDAQLFFVAYAQHHCGTMSADRLRHYIQADQHSPGRTRIQGTLADSKGFLEAFSCPSKQPQCELW